jgi:hypothetical protein
MNLHYTAWKVTGEQWTVRGLDGTGRDLAHVLSWHFPEEMKTWSGQQMFLPRFEHSTSRIQVSSVTATLTCSVGRRQMTEQANHTSIKHHRSDRTAVAGTYNVRQIWNTLPHTALLSPSPTSNGIRRQLQSAEAYGDCSPQSRGPRC